MMKPRCHSRASIFAVLFLFAAHASFAVLTPANSPIIEKVDPPNWWIGLPDPMVLIKGENLAGAKVTIFPAKPGVRVDRTEDGLNGRYLFVWIKIANSTLPGEVSLRITTAIGSRTLKLPLERRNKAAINATENGGFNGFGPDDVIYLIMPDRFSDGDPINNEPVRGETTYDRSNPRAYHGGDLKGLEKRLPYLKDLGITTIWTTPIYDNAASSREDYHGYGAVDYYGVEDHFGNIAAYKAMVNAAHALGLKVIFDDVPNHIGPKHPWTSAPPTAQWFHGTPQKHLRAHSPFATLADLHSTPAQWRDVVEGWFADLLPDMNTEDPLVSQYLRQNAMWWIETAGLDGLREDTFPYVGRQFWHDFHAEMHGLYPRMRAVGEAWDGDPAVVSYFAGGKTVLGVDTGVDSLFDFPLMFTLREVLLRNAPVERIPAILRQDWLYPRPDDLVTFIGNHDTKRFSSEEGASPEKLRLAFSLLMTLRGIPQIYSGDEIGMHGGDDPDNRRDFPGGFPGDKRDAFSVAGRTAEEHAVFAHLQSLLKLRIEHIALREGKLFHLASDPTMYAFAREYQGAPKMLGGKSEERLLVVFNNDVNARKLSLSVADTPLAGPQSVNPIFSATPAKIVNGNSIEMEVAPNSVAIYEVIMRLRTQIGKGSRSRKDDASSVNKPTSSQRN